MSGKEKDYKKIVGTHKRVTKIRNACKRRGNKTTIQKFSLLKPVEITYSNRLP